MKRFSLWTCALALGGCVTSEMDNEPVTTETAQQVLGTPEGGDDFGRAFVVADFNGDTFDDLAVGAPGEAPGSGVRSGSVYIYLGSPNGLRQWNRIDETMLNNTFAADGDRFGVALAAADFDGDGKAELIIGAPHSHTQNTPNGHCGVVYLLPGSAIGPTTTSARTIDEPTLPRDGLDSFGSNLAVGNLDSDSAPELAIVAPGAKVNGTRTGWISVYNVSASLAPTYRNGVTGVVFAENANLGSGLVITDLDHDGNGDIVAGAPFDDTVSGAVYIYRGTDTGGFHNGLVIRSSQVGDRFGATVVTGQFDDQHYGSTPVRKHELVIGAPTRDSTAGRLYQYTPMVTSSGFSMEQTKGFGIGLIDGFSPEAGDRLGTSLAVADLENDGFDDLVVGIPGRETGVFSNGAAVVYKGSLQGITTNSENQILTWLTAINGSHVEIPSGGMFSDALGSTVAVGRFDHFNGADVIVGMPDRTVHGVGARDAGAFLEYERTNSSDHHQQLRQYWDESTALVP